MKNNIDKKEVTDIKKKPKSKKKTKNIDEIQSISDKFLKIQGKNYKEIYTFYLTLLDGQEKKEFFHHFPEDKDDLFFQACKLQQENISADELANALNIFYLVKCIYILQHKSEYLALQLDPLLAGIIYNIKVAMMLGEESIRDLANLCGLFAIQKAEEIVANTENTKFLSQDEKDIMYSIEESLDILNHDKEAYLEQINESFGDTSNLKKKKQEKASNEFTSELTKYLNLFGSDNSNNNKN